MTPDQSILPFEVRKPFAVLIELFEAHGGRAAVMDARTTMLNRFSEDKGRVEPTPVERLVVEVSADTVWECYSSCRQVSAAAARAGTR